jgi:bacterioferritin (cytochrome b1)
MYGDIVNFFGTADPVTRRMFEDILKDEEDHADDLADVLYTADPITGKPVEQFTGHSTFKRLNHTSKAKN